jgi:prevent-host-death family protein
MRSVGVRELREQTSEIVRQVRESGETVEVTYRGKVVARLVPADEAHPDPDAAKAWLARWDKLAAEVSAQWPKGVSAVDAVREQRREL